MQLFCTCIYNPDQTTSRLEIEVFDPFCALRAHRISGSTKYEPGDHLHRS